MPPGLVQEYIDGGELCSYSVVHDGVVAAHLSYRLTITLDHAEECNVDADGLRDAVAATERYLARPSFSRSGVHLLTNVGPRAGRLELCDCAPG